MKGTRNLHLKIQELCDCYASNDPLKEMSEIQGGEDKEEAALKWFALAVLHGVNNNASEIAITRSSKKGVKVTAKYRKSELPSPGREIGEKIVSAVSAISHIEDDKGEIPLALGIRQDSLELNIDMKTKNKGEKVTIKFTK